MSSRPVVFLSCSGPLSRGLAGVLNDYLPQFIHVVEPFVSEVCPLLFGGLKPTDLSDPLASFQVTEFKKADFKQLLKSVNNSSKEFLISSEVLNNTFERVWPDLESAVNKILEAHKKEGAEEQRPVKTERQLLEEVALSVRGLKRNFSSQKKLSHSPSLLEELLSNLKLLEKQLSSSSALINTLEFSIKTGWSAEVKNNINNLWFTIKSINNKISLVRQKLEKQKSSDEADA